MAKAPPQRDQWLQAPDHGLNNSVMEHLTSLVVRGDVSSVPRLGCDSDHSEDAALLSQQEVEVGAGGWCCFFPRGDV
eukprot:m.306016 g.306016  ORF g.306016 m.306016 type:complete len:77 (+) comp19617_c0_seq1:3-233(+)